MIPKKLMKGDEIRIIAPSSSLGIISQENRELAIKRLGKLGLKISYSKNAEEIDEFESSSIESRVSDLHEAFLDKNVSGILAAIGGFNVNQILKYLNYDLIRNNPKIICGYSDITALSIAIYAKTGLVNYSGPAFANFGMIKGLDYTIDYFKKCLMNNDSFEVVSSEKWSDDKWYLDQEKRKFIKNNGELLINEGEAEGKIIGGNLCTLNLLIGTEFMPSIKNSILFLEDDEESKLKHFDRNLQSLLHQPEFSQARGLVIGRFQKVSEATNEKIIKMIKTKKELDDIPIVANLDFGHTSPLLTFPIGGKAKLSAVSGSMKLDIIEH
ncbi:MAG: LD-carboxypeptidase [Candidatus Falkowbacteria bacterium]|nr:LD-carboxypeptidase [Candidatus Falkowbacteria bacterium]